MLLSVVNGDGIERTDAEGSITEPQKVTISDLCDLKCFCLQLDYVRFVLHNSENFLYLVEIGIL